MPSTREIGSIGERGAADLPLRRPRITERYSGYSPAFELTPIVSRILDSVPPKYLMGLSEVVLTSSSGLPRKLRRSVTKSRKRKVWIREARGLYHPARPREEAWIEIFVDNTFRTWEKGWWLKVSYLREILLADVLFHEIGHHIHETAHSEYRDKED